VRQGRRREFAAFEWNLEPPDPQDEATFRRAKLNHQLRHSGRHRTLREFYRELIRLRKELAPLARLSKAQCDVTGYDSEKVMLVRRWHGDQSNLILLNYNAAEVSFSPAPGIGSWQKIFDSAEQRWDGPGTCLADWFNAGEQSRLSQSATSFAIFQAAPTTVKTTQQTQERSTG
jgi:maltooligosyltrehalose trehalohydrolase